MFDTDVQDVHLANVLHFTLSIFIVPSIDGCQCSVFEWLQQWNKRVHDGSHTTRADIVMSIDCITVGVG